MYVRAQMLRHVCRDAGTPSPAGSRSSILAGTMADTEPDPAPGHAQGSDDLIELLYPFYLDADMSMAFAAAMTGGVALEEEQVDRSSDSSQAIRNLRGNLRAWRVGGFEAGREATEGSDSTRESRLVRRHTDASIFISLYDELASRGQLRKDPAFEDIGVGDLVAVKAGPASAPLRRVVEQVIRLLDLMAPTLGIEPERQDRQQGARTSRSSKRPQPHPSSKHAEPDTWEAIQNHGLLSKLFRSLRDDLEQSGMIDIVVVRDDLPNVVLTLDKRFVSAPTLELLHTSRFTVVGKVSEVWPTDTDFVNLYRRSVLSLVPALAQSTAWGLFALLGVLGGSIDVTAMQRAANAAIGLPMTDQQSQEAASEQVHADGAPETTEVGAGPTSDIMMSPEAIAALVPGMSGPAFQILPLAICS